MGKKVEQIDAGVKVVYVSDIAGEYKLCTGEATIYSNGSMVIGNEDSDTYVTREAGEWWTYLTFKQASGTMYAKAVELAKKKVGITK